MKKRNTFIIFVILLIGLTACSKDANIQPEVIIQSEVDEDQKQVNTQVVSGDTQLEIMTGTPAPLDFATYFSVEYEDALNPRNQLAVGTLKLAETDYPITTDQSKTLLPLWQAILVLESNPGSSSQELSAVQNQIMFSMTSDQLDAILTFQLTNDHLLTIYNELGISLVENIDGTTMGSGQGNGKGSGAGQDPAAREATRAAAEALGTPTSERGAQGQNNKNQLTEAVIDYLIQLAES
ncbi:MAG: hypothetical protein CL609_09975 [Anaerolineaceae bacterium]|nr:hypothetical protein [Anaerolineaceae bacterium]